MLDYFKLWLGIDDYKIKQTAKSTYKNINLLTQLLIKISILWHGEFHFSFHYYAEIQHNTLKKGEEKNISIKTSINNFL